MDKKAHKRMLVGGCISRALFGYAMMAPVIYLLLHTKPTSEYGIISWIIYGSLWAVVAGVLLLFTWKIYRIIKEGLKEIEEVQTFN